MKRWYKGNLHSHTTNSDGVWTPEQSAKIIGMQDILFVFQ